MVIERQRFRIPTIGVSVDSAGCDVDDLAFCAAVRAWDRQTETHRTFPLVECAFRAGGSRFQEVLADGSPRFEILDVAFLFTQGDLTEPVRDPALAAALGVEMGRRASLIAVRDIVPGLRRTSGLRASDV